MSDLHHFEAWEVQPDSFTQFVRPSWDGDCEELMFQLPSIDWERIPVDFKLGVVFGPSGSGKTTLAQMLARRAKLDSRVSSMEASPVFRKDIAVVSHPDFKGEALNRLSAVGLNKIPSWCRPYHVLSNGEQSRVRTALSLRNGAVLDDFAQVVDDAQATSMAASLVKLARREGYKKIVVSSTKSCVLPFLEPDFVLFAKSGKVVLNPYAEALRAPRFTWDFRISSFSKAGWESTDQEIDDGKADSTFAGGTPLRDVVSEKPIHVEVKMDEHVSQACHAFDYEFTGVSTSNINSVNFERLRQHIPKFQLAAILGPSGSGKSQCLNDVGADVAMESDWNNSKSVFSQLTASDPSLAKELCEAVALPLDIALRPFHVLSQGEQHRACLARQLDASLRPSADGCWAIGLDEFTSVLDRRLAKKVCFGINQFVKTHSTCRPLIVATVHQDIALHLEAQWILDTEKSSMLEMPQSQQQKKHVSRGLSFRLSQTDGDEEEVKQLLKPPVINLIVKRLADCRETKRVFLDSFEQHHYMKGNVPTGIYGVVVRTGKANALVAFHGIAYQFGSGMGNTSMRESRLVVLPEFQGFGIGPKLSDHMGQLLIDSGRSFFSVTHHPRLGGYREHSKLWKATMGNAKVHSKDIAGKETKARTSFRHLFLGSSEDGNRGLVLEQLRQNGGLLKSKGKIVLKLTANPRVEVLESIRKMHGKTPREYLNGCSSKSERFRKRGALDMMLKSAKHIELREVDDAELLQLEEHLQMLLANAGVIVPPEIQAALDALKQSHPEAESSMHSPSLKKRKLASMSPGSAFEEELLLQTPTSPGASESLSSPAVKFASDTEATFEDPQLEEPSLASAASVRFKPSSSCKKAIKPKAEKKAQTKVQKTKTILKSSPSEFPSHAILLRTGKEAKTEYIVERLAKVAGKSIAEACDGSVTFTRPNGVCCKYKLADAKYDVLRGHLKLGSNSVQNDELDEESAISCAGG
jgi:ABC-type glutathione transport system ATPase component